MGLRVIEVGHAAAGYCGRLFAHLGAEVLRLVPDDMIDPENVHDAAAQAQQKSLNLYLHTGKRSVALNGRHIADAAQAFLAAGAVDVLVVEGNAALLTALAWLEVPAKVRIAITPFGLTGPCCDWQASSSVLLAMGGYTALMGDSGRAPLTLPGHYPEYQSGQYAYLSGLACWLAIRDGRAAANCTIDVSMWESVLSLSQFTTVMWTFSGRVRARNGNDWDNLAPLSLFRCVDGWFVVNIVPNFWAPFTLMLGRPELLLDPRFATNDARMANKPALHAIIEEVLGVCTMADVLERGQRQSRVPTGIALSLQQVLDDEHLSSRGAWHTVGDATGQLLRAPAVPFRYVARRTADTTTDSVKASFAKASAAREARVDAYRSATVAPQGPLAGTRVLDFTHVWAGPLATRILADLGAEVVKVEAPFVRGPANVGPTRAGIYPDDVLGPDPWNRQGIFNKLNRNKLGVAVDIKHAEGRALVTDLVRRSDVVIDNFSARAMGSMGFDIAALQALNPSIIHVTMPGYGTTGPYSGFVAYGPSVEPMAGFTALMGYSDAEPRVSAIALPDAIAGVTAATAVVTALYRRDVLGETGLLECALHEGAVAMLGEYFIRCQLDGKPPTRHGNGHPVHAPQGVYRCAADAVVGDDAWIAIAVTTTAQWRALAALLALPEHPEWRTTQGRRADAQAIHELIEAYTRRHDRLQLMRRLQSAGVPAGAVLTAPDWLNDEHLRARKFFVPLGAAHIETLPYPGSPMQIDGRRGEDWFAAPRLGQHNAFVACEQLGWSAQRLAAAQASGACVERPPDLPPH